MLTETYPIETLSSDYALVAQAIEYLEANRRRQPTLDELAQHLAVSPFHLQRLFKRWAGISPKRFVQYLTVEHAKQLLATSHSVLETAYATGLSGPGRLHDLFVGVEAMTPGEYKEGGSGLKIGYGVHSGPFGDYMLAITERGVCGLTFLNGGGKAGEVAALQARWPQARLIEDPQWTAPIAEQIFAQTPEVENEAAGNPVGPAGKPVAATRPELRLLLAGTNFQVKVWEALLRIPPGSVSTYEDVAHAVGQPTAARAVGSAIGSNWIAYLIPCHRVIRKSGVIEEYRWGPTRKKAMLGWEAAHYYDA
jgi:AraC family transcriptional regulator, regulatory protein of adaptative response / methylated-DNA-[protein]-cysteine methyltransferase